MKSFIIAFPLEKGFFSPKQVIPYDVTGESGFMIRNFLNKVEQLYMKFATLSPGPGKKLKEGRRTGEVGMSGIAQGPATILSNDIAIIPRHLFDDLIVDITKSLAELELTEAYA